MKLILVRHAKAEHVYGKSDRERSLTPEGIKRFKPKAKKLAEQLNNQDKVFVWASTANRAQETADIIVENLDIEIVSSTEQAIYYGDFDELLDKMELLETGDTVILVGHQPSLSYWSGYLTGESVPFRTGDMACFRIFDLDPLSADLLWMIT
ncbi:MAG: hypothetical protein GX145_04285 [Clostridiaceae bacterium]|nr:hypothetical protein [Clostridiaceae bacterium]